MGILSRLIGVFNRKENWSDPETLTKWAKSKDWTERVNAAKSVYTPLEILKELSNDPFWDVRATARKTINFLTFIKNLSVSKQSAAK